ncbi:serine hydroxymethyltransferase [Streptomyces amakusaensis]|uniref:Serine hydroxymethyltransferase-like domain-containing protein n=1 Tax=Streptomyces amakusaensis TaxID=67271 RepID=A0ABW0AMB3_9ACTN
MNSSPPSGAELLTRGLSVLRAHEERAQLTLSLIPAENLMAPVTRLPLTSDLHARYLFDEAPDPADGDWRFPAGKEAAWLETGLAVPLLRRLTGAAAVNVRPLSGLHAMQMVIAALGGPPGSTIACLAPAQGGHYATADIARQLGCTPVHLPGRGMHDLNEDELGAFLGAHRPALVYVDQCHALTSLDIRPIAAAIKERGLSTVLHVDISHTLGLVLGGALPNPLTCGADSISASTHKSFPGPQKGVIATRTAETGARIAAIQPRMVSSHHFAAVAALGLSLAAFADHAGPYARAVIANARALGQELARSGWVVAGAGFGFTRTHQLWVARTPQPTARDAAARLYGAGLHVNWLTDLPLGHDALRLGLAEATWLGLGAADMPRLAGVMTAAADGSVPLDELARRTAALRPGPARLYPFTPRLDEAPQESATGVHSVPAGVLR